MYQKCVHILQVWYNGTIINEEIDYGYDNQRILGKPTGYRKRLFWFL